LARATVDAQAPFTGRHPAVAAIDSTSYPTPARRPQNSELDTSLFERTFRIQPRPWMDDLHAVVRELSVERLRSAANRSVE
jgi:dTDP-4-dehydrorhamnose reductase